MFQYWVQTRFMLKCSLSKVEYGLTHSWFKTWIFVKIVFGTKVLFDICRQYGMSLSSQAIIGSFFKQQKCTDFILQSIRVYTITPMDKFERVLNSHQMSNLNSSCDSQLAKLLIYPLCQPIVLYICKKVRNQKCRQYFMHQSQGSFHNEFNYQLHIRFSTLSLSHSNRTELHTWRWIQRVFRLHVWIWITTARIFCMLSQFLRKNFFLRVQIKKIFEFSNKKNLFCSGPISLMILPTEPIDFPINQRSRQIFFGLDACNEFSLSKRNQ